MVSRLLESVQERARRLLYQVRVLQAVYIHRCLLNAAASSHANQEYRASDPRAQVEKATMARLTSPIFTHLLKVLFAAAGLANTLQPHVRINNRLVRATRDENFIDTPGSPQDLCGESTFEVLEDESGPLRDDCALLHQTVEKNLHGFWVASKMGSDGTVWVEFTRLRSCGLKIRRTDGQSADIP